MTDSAICMVVSGLQLLITFVRSTGIHFSSHVPFWMCEYIGPEGDYLLAFLDFNAFKRKKIG